jgi:hypothetical protein
MFLSLLLFPFLTLDNPNTERIFYFMEKIKLLPAYETEIQKQLSKYSKKTEFADILHLLRYTRKLRAPESVQTVLDWIAEMNGKANVNNGVGAFYHSEGTIAKETGLSLSTVERAIRWLKKHGFLKVLRAWNYEKGEHGSAYKVFASTKAIKLLVQAIINENNQAIETMINAFNNEVDEIVKKLTGSVTGSVTDNKRPEIKDQDNNKTYNNRLGEKADKQPSSTLKNPFKGVPPEIEEIAKSTPWSDEEQIKIAKKIWNALKDTNNKNITDEVRIKISCGIRNAITKEKAGQIKNPNKIAEFIYKCVRTELDGFFTKTEVKIEGTQKHVHEHHHHHVFEKKKKKTINDYMREKYGDNCFDDMFPYEKEEETPERKILTDDDVTIKDISKEEETEAFNEAMQGFIETGATKELLPDWYDDFVKKEREKDEKRQQEQKQEPKMSIEEMLKALRDNTSPETGLQAF